MARKLDISQIEKELKRLKQNKPPLHQRYNKSILYGSLGVILIAVLFFTLLFSGVFDSGYGLAVQCMTKECFIDAANECKPSYYETKIETMNIAFSTNSNCELTKKVLSIDESEPISIQNLFRSTSMECPYNKGEFSRKYIDQISYDLMTCEGTMVDAIKNIL